MFSPVGTPLLDRTVGEIVAEVPGQSRVFQAFGIDFCCQGGRTLREACARKGISAESVVEQLEAGVARNLEEYNPAELEAGELADYIVRKHHRYLREELPRLLTMAARVAQVHGGHTPSLVEVSEVLLGLAEELALHMMKEEEMLFPCITRMSRGEPIGIALDAPIDCMLDEHVEAGAALDRLRELTNAYQPPVEACNTYRALFDGLADLENDLHHHIHLENAVLFPVALKLAEQLG